MYEDDVDLNTIVPVDYDEDQPTTSENGPTKFKDPEKGTGIIYLSTIPPAFNASKIRDAFSNFGDVGRIYLQVSVMSCFALILFNFRQKSLNRRIVDAGSLKDGLNSKRSQLPKKLPIVWTANKLVASEELVLLILCGVWSIWVVSSGLTWLSNCLPRSVQRSDECKWKLFKQRSKLIISSIKLSRMNGLKRQDYDLSLGILRPRLGMSRTCYFSG